MEILNKIKLLLLSFFGLSISGNCNSLSSFFILAKSTAGAQGYIYPLFRNNNHRYKTGDASLLDNMLYKKRATEIVQFFIQENKTCLPEDINENEILKNIITGPNFTGESADIILYAALLSFYKKINLDKIFIAGSGQISFDEKKITAIGSLFCKIDAALAYGIKIFIFSSEQKKDIENYFKALNIIGQQNAAETLHIYYIDTINQLENILLDISDNKKNVYEENIVKHIHNKANIANVIIGPVYTLEMTAVQEYIKNKKEYGSCLSNDDLEKNITEIVSHINNEKKLMVIIDTIKALAITVKIYMLTKNYNEQKKIIENVLEKNLFNQNTFYKDYYNDCLENSIITDLNILDI